MNFSLCSKFTLHFPGCSICNFPEPIHRTTRHLARFCHRLARKLKNRLSKCIRKPLVSMFGILGLSSSCLIQMEVPGAAGVRVVSCFILETASSQAFHRDLACLYAFILFLHWICDGMCMTARLKLLWRAQSDFFDFLGLCIVICFGHSLWQRVPLTSLDIIFICK